MEFVIITVIVFFIELAFLIGVVANRNDKKIIIVSPTWTRYEPTASFWMIEFCLYTVQDLMIAPVIKSVKIKGVDITGSLKGISEQIPINKVEGITKTQLARWDELRRISYQNNLTDKEESEYQKLHKLIQEGLKDGPKGVEIYMATDELPFDIVEGQTYPISLEIYSEAETYAFTTEVYVFSLPSHPNWNPAELHAHSNFSDGTKKLVEMRDIYKNKGYKILYMTDHSNMLQKKGWSNYTKAVFEATPNDLQGIKLYPGTELTVKYKNPDSGDVQYGDLLAYGIKDLKGLENRVHSPQVGINNILANNPDISSPAIAHPYRITFSRLDWLVYKYRGFEVISGIQMNFSDSASPMIKWRSELTRLLSDTFKHGYFASARTAGDYHARGETVKDYVTYLGTKSWSAKSSVDLSLYNGKTIASRYGGLGYFELIHGRTTTEIGDKLTGVAAGETLILEFTFKPIKSGEYTITIYQDDKQEKIYTTSKSYNAGGTYTSRNDFVFPGGQHYYYLYISGSDYVYSSPIFVSD
ncbi:MAG TPA: PHP domain-containing protein [Thermoanaerobacterales bacterium]|jgi:hypothetical protein|nr:PHP domain-containing protein [Thermoanaerobacterales bacterium]